VYQRGKEVCPNQHVLRSNRTKVLRTPKKPFQNAARGLVLYTSGWFIVSFALWLWFVDSLALPEAWVGLAVAALATTLALVVWLYSPVRFRPRVRWARWLRGVPLGVLRDSGVLGLALWRRLARGERPRSAFRLVPFPDAGDDDPESVTWRAFVIAATSITPNTYVIGVDCERKTVLVHQLVPDSAEQVRRRVVGADSA
jgi:multisubunit Na+/H+ antiporter MnhE subunit